MVQYKGFYDWPSPTLPRRLFDTTYSVEGYKMAARILSRLNWISRTASRRSYADTASPKMSLAEKEAAETKHAECKSNGTLTESYLLKK